MSSQAPDLFEYRRLRVLEALLRVQASAAPAPELYRTPCGVAITKKYLESIGFPLSTEHPFLTCSDPHCVPCRAAEARAGAPI